jgi:hypothetical protein
MDPLSLLSRLATSVPPPRFRTTVRHFGALAAASGLRPLITPQSPEAPAEEPKGKSWRDRFWTSLPGVVRRDGGDVARATPASGATFSDWGGPCGLTPPLPSPIVPRCPNR